LCEVGPSGELEGVDQGVSDDDHGVGRGPGAEGGGVFAEGGVPDPVEPVFDGAPVPAQVPTELFGTGFGWDETGDAVGDFLGMALPVEAADVADDPENLCRIREIDR
jgi:hypothetical protein